MLDWFFCSSQDWFWNTLTQQQEELRTGGEDVLSAVNEQLYDSLFASPANAEPPFIVLNREKTTAYIFTARQDLQNFLFNCRETEKAAEAEQAAKRRLENTRREFKQLTEQLEKLSSGYRQLCAQEKEFVETCSCLGDFVANAVNERALSYLAKQTRRAENENMPNKDELVHLMELFGCEPIEPRPNDPFCSAEHANYSPSVPLENRVVSRLSWRGWKLNACGKTIVLLPAAVEIQIND